MLKLRKNDKYAWRRMTKAVLLGTYFLSLVNDNLLRAINVMNCRCLVILKNISLPCTRDPPRANLRDEAFV